MALVVLLRGVNVGGRRVFRPAALAEELQRLGAVNIGAAGTFVIRKPVGRAQLRAAFESRLPFETEIVICQGRDILRMMSRDCYAGHLMRPGIVRFVSVLSRVPRAPPPLPVILPARRGWLLKVVGREGRFVFGVYRRHVKVVGDLGALDRLFGVPATTRSWRTLDAIARALAFT